jgi:hypothetical protein
VFTIRINGTLIENAIDEFVEKEETHKKVEKINTCKEK